MKPKLWGNFPVPNSPAPSSVLNVSTQWCHQPGHVHKRSPVTAPSSFTAVDKILGYKIASLNRVFESSPEELQQLQLPEHDTWRLFTAWTCKEGATLSCFQIFFFFCLLPKQWNEKFKLFHQGVFSSVFLFCFCFQARELLKFVFSKTTVILHVLWSWKQSPVVCACACGYFVFLWHLPQVPMQSLHYLRIWQPNCLNAAAPHKLSVVHCIPRKKWSFIFDPGFASNFQ